MVRIDDTTFKDDPGWRFRKIDLDQTSRSVNFIGKYYRNYILRWKLLKRNRFETMGKELGIVDNMLCFNG